MNRCLITALTFVLAIDSTSAQISDRERQALNNTQHEMTTCAVYYAMVRQCLLNRARPNEDGKLIQDTDGSIDRLVKDATRLGSSLGMTKDAMGSRMVNDRAMMRELINNDCINVSSLLRRYAARCKQVAENPDSILIEHMTPR
jgi:hypothetical protein